MTTRIKFLTNPTPNALMTLLARSKPLGDHRLVRGLLSSEQVWYVWDAGQGGEEIVHRDFAEALELEWEDVPANSQFRVYLHPDGVASLSVPGSGASKHKFIARIAASVEQCNLNLVRRSEA